MDRDRCYADCAMMALRQHVLRQNGGAKLSRTRAYPLSIALRLRVGSLPTILDERDLTVGSTARSKKLLLTQASVASSILWNMHHFMSNAFNMIWQCWIIYLFIHNQSFIARHLQIEHRPNCQWMVWATMNAPLAALVYLLLSTSAIPFIHTFANDYWSQF